MLPPIKLIKIALPVATVTTATIATVSLVSSKKEDEKLDSSKEDTVLKDFDKPVEEFEEQIMLYSKDGTQESKTISREELEKLSKIASQNQAKGPDSLSDTDESVKGSPEASKQSVTDDDQNQVSLSDVNGFLGNQLKPDNVEGEPKDDVDLSNPTEDISDDEAKGDDSDDGQKLGINEDVPSEDHGIDREPTKLDSGENGKLGEENQEVLKNSAKTEPQSPVDSNDETTGNEKDHNSDQEPTPSSDALSTQDGNVSKESGESQEIGGENQEVSPPTESSSDSGSLSNSKFVDGGGEASSVSESSGQDDGVAGEHGQELMTQEQLQRIAAMGQEVEEVLGVLGNLFKE